MKEQSKNSFLMGRSGGASLQARIATASFVAAVAFSIAGFIVPPLGDLTEANLYLVAQFLLVTTSIFGVSSIVTRKFNEKNKVHNHSLLSGETNADEQCDAD